MKQKIYGLVLSPSMSICGLVCFESLRAKTPNEWSVKYYGNELDRKAGNYEAVMRSHFTDYRIHKPGHDGLFNGQPVVVNNDGKPLTLTGRVVDMSGIPPFTVGDSDHMHRNNPNRPLLTVSDAAAMMFLDIGEQTFPGESTVRADFNLFTAAQDGAVLFKTSNEASNALREAARNLLKTADDFDANCAAAGFLADPPVDLNVNIDDCFVGRLSVTGRTQKAEPAFVLKLLREQLMKNISNAQRKEELTKQQRTLAEQLEKTSQELAKLG